MKSIFVFLIASFFVSAAQAGTIDISAYIDGKSELIIEDDTMYWHHSTFAAPGRWSETDLPTIINGVDWLPVWPAPGRNDFCNCESSSVTGLFPALSSLLDVSFNVVNGRVAVSLLDAPSAANGYRMEIAFDDFFGGADWYTVQISYSDADVPEPFPIGLLAIGLFGLFMSRKNAS